MESEKVEYKGNTITVYTFHMPNKRDWVAEISINGTPYPISRVPFASKDAAHKSALSDAYAILDKPVK